MSHPTDLERLRLEYSEREKRLSGSSQYSLLNPAYLFAIQQRQRSLMRALNREGLTPVANRKILEVGCGAGGVLLEFLSLGVKPTCLVGVDILRGRLAEAHEKMPYAGITCSDGQALPFPDHSFDLVLQFTAFSSVLDGQIRERMAGEMLRTVSRDGAVIWYDFWLNPLNRQTRGIRPPEIKALFPGCRISLHKITLAPPIARRVIPLSWMAGCLLESLAIFNTHYLAVIRPARG